MNKGSCTSVDLEAKGGPLYDVPVFNQLGPNCYAYAATVMAESWRRGHSKADDFLGSPVSVIQGIKGSTCLSNQAQDKPECTGGRQFKEALKVIGSQQLCDHRALFGNKRDSFDETQFKLIDQLLTSQKDYHAWIGKNRNQIDQVYLELRARHPDWTVDRITLETNFELVRRSNVVEKLCQTLESPLEGSFLFTGNLSPRTQLALWLGKSPDERGLIDDYINDSCKNHSMKMDLPPFESYGVSQTTNPLVNLAIKGKSPADALNDFDKKLNANPPEALGVVLCSGVFKEPFKKLKTIDPNPLAELSYLCTDQSSHAVVVTGRAWNEKTQKCEYKIRNSWGTGCGEYAPEIDCANGRVWLDAQTLLDNTLTYTQFRKN
jgi:hypothetical protein